MSLRPLTSQPRPRASSVLPVARCAYWAALAVLLVHAGYLALLTLSLNTVASLDTTGSALFGAFPLLGLAALVVAVLPPGQRPLTRLGGNALLALNAFGDILLVALVRGSGGIYVWFLAICVLSIAACVYLLVQRHRVSRPIET